MPSAESQAQMTAILSEVGTLKKIVRAHSISITNLTAEGYRQKASLGTHKTEIETTLNSLREILKADLSHHHAFVRSEVQAIVDTFHSWLSYYVTGMNAQQRAESIKMAADIKVLDERLTAIPVQSTPAQGSPLPTLEEDLAARVWEDGFRDTIRVPCAQASHIDFEEDDEELPAYTQAKDGSDVYGKLLNIWEKLDAGDEKGRRFLKKLFIQFLYKLESATNGDLLKGEVEGVNKVGKGVSTLMDLLMELELKNGKGLGKDLEVDVQNEKQKMGEDGKGKETPKLPSQVDLSPPPASKDCSEPEVIGAGCETTTKQPQQTPDKPVAAPAPRTTPSMPYPTPRYYWDYYHRYSSNPQHTASGTHSRRHQPYVTDDEHFKPSVTNTPTRTPPKNWMPAEGTDQQRSLAARRNNLFNFGSGRCLNQPKPIRPRFVRSDRSSIHVPIIISEGPDPSSPDLDLDSAPGLVPTSPLTSASSSVTSQSGGGSGEFVSLHEGNGSDTSVECASVERWLDNVDRVESVAV